MTDAIEMTPALAEHEARLRAEREKLEAERRAIELEKAKAEAAERARREEQERVEREAKLKAEREQRERQEVERRERMKPDKEKLLSLADRICRIDLPTVHDQECGEVLGYAITKLELVRDYIKEQVSKM